MPCSKLFLAIIRCEFGCPNFKISSHIDQAIKRDSHTVFKALSDLENEYWGTLLCMLMMQILQWTCVCIYIYIYIY